MDSKSELTSRRTSEQTSYIYRHVEVFKVTNLATFLISAPAKRSRPYSTKSFAVA